MDVEPRPLTPAERSILDLLLAHEFDGAAELREQVATARVVGRCDCGCPTVYIEPSPGTRSSEVRTRLAPIEGRVEPVGDGPPGDIMLFLDGGRLDSLEYVWYGDVPPKDWPTLDRISVIELPR
jgi:hypothetical protein